MLYKISFDNDAEDYLINEGCKLTSFQRKNLLNVFNELKSNPKIGQHGPPLPIAIQTDYYLIEKINNNKYVAIFYDFSHKSNIILVRAIKFTDYRSQELV